MWGWVQLSVAAIASALLAVSVLWDRQAAEIKTLDRFNEAWALLHRSRMALFASMALAAVAVAVSLTA